MCTRRSSAHGRPPLRCVVQGDLKLMEGLHFTAGDPGLCVQGDLKLMEGLHSAAVHGAGLLSPGTSKLGLPGGTKNPCAVSRIVAAQTEVQARKILAQ